MPINIYNSESSERVDWICDGDWELPSQIDKLEIWLQENRDKLIPASYVADIGFDIRKDACGGGAVLSSQAMKIMVDIGMELFLSEYPDGGEE